MRKDEERLTTCLSSGPSCAPIGPELAPPGHSALWWRKLETLFSAKQKQNMGASVNMEGAGFMTSTAASHQGAVDTFWLHFKEAA